MREFLFFTALRSILLPGLFFLMGLLQQVCAQSFDSIFGLSQEQKYRHLQAQFLVDESDKYSYGNPELAIKLGTKAYEISKEIKSDSLQLKSAYYVGTTYENKGFYRLGINWMDIAEKKAIEIDHKLWVARINNSKGICYDYLGQWDKAVEVYLKALNIFIDRDDKQGMSNTYNNLGLIKYNQKQYRIADSLYRMSLKIAESTGKPKYSAAALSNLGMLNKEMGNIEKALEYYVKTLAIELNEKPNNPAYLGSDYHNIASCFLALDQYDSAIAYQEKSIVYKKMAQNDRAISNSYNSMGCIYYEKGILDVSEKYFDSAWHLASKLENPWLQSVITKAKANLAIKQNRPEEAISLLKQHIQLKDTLFSREKFSVTSILEKEFETEKKDLELSHLAESVQKEKRTTTWLWSAIGLYTLLAAVLALLYRKNLLYAKKLSEKQLQLNKAINQLEGKNVQIELQKSQLQEALTVKSNFLSMMSHEIRTPLNVILGISDILRRENLAEEHKLNVEVLYNASKQLIILFNNILDFHKIDAGMMFIDRKEFNLEENLTYLSRSHEIQAMEKGVELFLNYDKRIPAQLEGDEIKLTQILNNLLSNAVKFTSQGRITLSADCIYQNETEVCVRFEVADTGTGIEKKDTDRIFLPFQQGDATTVSRNSGGTGLGLAISKNLVELMSGELEVMSEKNVGSKFYFKLVFRKCSPGPDQSKKNQTDDYSWIENKKILVAEDNEHNVMVLKQLFKKLPAQAEWAENGKEAVGACEHTMYDLILMDLHMPVMDGKTAAGIIRASSLNISTPIIGVTAADKHEINEMSDTGLFLTFLFKPYEAAEFYLKLKEGLAENLISSKS